jgi:hypothetical protein
MAECGEHSMMPGTEALPFFEREKGSTKVVDSESYVAGFRTSGDAAPFVRIALPTEIVDKAVLTGAQLSVWLSAGDGRLILDGNGVDCDTLEAARATGPMREQTLLTLVEACLEPDHLSKEDDPIGDLASLRAQLVEALAKVDGALVRLRRG